MGGMPSSPTTRPRHVLAREERLATADALLQAGPDAPTLCAGWTGLDLAAHLVVRGRRPDAMVGIVVPPLAGYTERVRKAAAARGLDELVATIRSGPPAWSPVRIPAVEGATDLVEFLVHHEDVRRGTGAGPRTDVPELQRAAWDAMTTAGRMTLRGSPVGVVAVRPDGVRRVLRKGQHPVVLTGEPMELLLYLFGRRGAAVVDEGGPSLSVSRFREHRLGV